MLSIPNEALFELETKNEKTQEELNSELYYLVVDVVAGSPYASLSEIRELRQNGANINAIERNSNMTPLHYAVDQGSADAVKLLIENGANPNTQNTLGDTALHYAIRKKNWGMMEILINRGADISVKNTDGNAPLCDAVQERESDTALHYAAQEWDTKLAEELINNGAEINAKNTLGDTPLHDAVQAGDNDMVSMLIEKWADVNIKNTLGDTPLHYATRNGGLANMATLVDNGADINVKNTDGNAPLHDVTQQGNSVAAIYLAELGANIEIENKNKETAIFLIENKSALIQASIGHLARLAAELPAENSRAGWSIVKSQPGIIKLKGQIFALLELAQEHDVTAAYEFFKPSTNAGNIIDHHRHYNASELRSTATRIRADKIIYGHDIENQSKCGCGPSRT